MWCDTDGLSANTREVLWDFAYDSATIDELNLRERMDAVRAALIQAEHGASSTEAQREGRAPLASGGRPRSPKAGCEKAGES